MQVKLSIILATYNWPEALLRILTILVPLVREDGNCELLIADDGSGDDTKNLISQFITNNSDLVIKHLWHEDHGFRKAAILNKAVLASSGDYLIFLDGDCVPFPDFIAKHRALMQPKCFVAGNRILLSKIYTADLLSQPVSALNMLFTNNHFRWCKLKFTGKINKILVGLRLSSSWWRHLRRKNWTFPKGCNFAVWSSDYHNVNGFDEVFRGWGHEDADLFIRLLHTGVTIKDGKFAIPVLHLWHAEFSRDKEMDNKKRLLARAKDYTIKEAQLGILQHKD